MKFSVLLPTRNRLEFLKYAITSVLGQKEESDWEIIVSDNASEEDIFGYIQSLDDPRIKYFRSDTFISVTENWNRALNKSSGEWVIMLGDDDCLMKGYFSTINELITSYPNPEFIYSSSFLYAYPKVLPKHPDGLLLVWNNANFLKYQSPPFWLTKEKSFESVRQIFNFRTAFACNVQFATIHRSLIEKLKYQGNFFHSLYPDFYAMIAMMLKADRILVCSQPLVTVGISPKSYGFYYFNDLEDVGISQRLNNEKERKLNCELEQIILPGTDMNTCWLLTLLEIIKNFQLSELKPNYKRYRFAQIKQFYKRYMLKEKTSSFGIWKKLSWKEISCFALPFYIGTSLIRLLPLKMRLKFVKSFSPLNSEIISDKYENLLQVFEKIDPRIGSIRPLSKLRVRQF